MLDQLVDVQRQRLEIFAREQRELAQFLTPVQRAKYATLQEGLRKKVEQLRQQQQENGLTPQQRRRLRQNAPNGGYDGLTDERRPSAWQCRVSHVESDSINTDRSARSIARASG